MADPDESGPEDAGKKEHAAARQDDTVRKPRNSLQWLFLLGKRVLRKTQKRNEANQYEPDHAKRVADWTRGLTWVTAALVSVGLLQFGAALLQWRSMNDQLAEMRGATPDTKKIVQANQDLASGMKLQAENTAALVAQTGRSADAAIKNLQAQNRHFQIGERPIIDLVNCQPPVKFGLGIGEKYVGWNYCFRNIGHTNARDVYTTEYISINGEPLRVAGRLGRISDVPPSEDGWHTILAKSLKPEDVPSVLGKLNGVVAAVRWEYKDLEGNQYRSDVCWSTLPNGAIGQCSLSDLLKGGRPPALQQ